MYIEKIIIKNYRTFDEEGIELKFNKGINSIIGANNTGKSAVIDAIRLALSISDYKKNIHFDIDDFHIDDCGEKADWAEIHIYLSDVPNELIEIINLKEKDKGEFHVRFIKESKNGKEKIRYKLWGGEMEGNTVSSDFFDAFKVSYLNALRNVGVDLIPSKSSKITNLIKGLYKDEEDQLKLMDKFKSANLELASDIKIQKAKEIINSNILSIEKNIYNQTIDLGIVEPKFESIISSIKGTILSKWIYLKDKSKIEELISIEGYEKYIKEKNNQTYVDIEKVIKDDFLNSHKELLAYLLNLKRIQFEFHQNGLGYNNIIYIASVLGDMEHSEEGVLSKIFLIEEPEAHLHPQLQRLLQLFLEDKCSKDNSIQIIYTSHSPSIVSKIDLNKVNLVLDSNDRKICSTLEQTKADKYDRSYIKRFLDVTKSQMLFSKGVIFVEGISEALIVSKMAEKLGYRLEDYQIEVVNIQGVSFKPFANLMTFENGNTFIKSIIITDDDRCTDKGDSETYIDGTVDYDVEDIDQIVSKLKAGTESARCKNLDKDIHGSGILCKKAFKTLEYELSLYNPNLMIEIIEKIHPIVGANLKTLLKDETSNEIKATRIWLCIKNRPEDKAKIALELLDRMEVNSITVPNYIEEAIIEMIS